MKKFIYAAILALTLGAFASCTGTSLGAEPVIDEKNGTINGKKYDNVNYACWQFDYSYNETCTDGEEGDSDAGTIFYWTTEFGAESIKAEFDWSHNWSAYAYGHGCKCEGSSTLKKTNHTQTECEAQ